MTKKAGVPGILSVREIGGVPRRTTHGGERPTCPKCNSSEHVIRMWHGKVKYWVCGQCYKVTSTRTQPASLKQRILHKLPEPETMAVAEVLPNRAARRRRK